MIKKITALLLAGACLIGTAWGDVETFGQRLQSQGIITGTESGLHEEALLTRAELMVIMTNLEGVSVEDTSTFPPIPFSDVDPYAWYAPYIQASLQHQWVNGYPDNTFRPNATVTYREAALILEKSLGYEPTWNNATTLASELKLLSNTNLQPDAPIQRGRIFEMVWNTMQHLEHAKQVQTTEDKKSPATPVYSELKLDITKVEAIDAQHLAIWAENIPEDMTLRFAKTDFAIDDIEVTDFSQYTERYMLLTTSPRKNNTRYTLTYRGDKTFDVGNWTEPSTPVELKETVGLDTGEVAINFTGLLDRKSATDLNNFLVESSSPLELTGATLTRDGSRVLLQAEGQRAGELYTVTISNLKDLNGTPIDTVYDKFGGVADKSKDSNGDFRMVDYYFGDDPHVVGFIFSKPIDPNTLNKEDFKISKNLQIKEVWLENNNTSLCFRVSKTEVGNLYTFEESTIISIDGQQINPPLRFAGRK